MAILGILGLVIVAAFALDRVFFRRLWYKIEGFIKPPAKIPSDSERSLVEFATEGRAVSVEKALNSRSTSDYDGNPKKFHWGIFDRQKTLSQDQIEEVVRLARIPRFTDQGVEIQTEGKKLQFSVAGNKVSGRSKNHALIESGMQQQAVGLVCAALGVGMVFQFLGENGASVSNRQLATTNMLLDAMEPSYDGSYWSTSPPAKEKPWLKGNLPNPVRDGGTSLLEALTVVNTVSQNGKKSSNEALSQLLWAARGRTPHFYKSRPWGMTIPTWRGAQHITSVYLISKATLFRYVNWADNRPTHAVESIAGLESADVERLSAAFAPFRAFVILARNQDALKADLEIGYQLLNLLLQSHSLDIAYRAALLDHNQRSQIARLGIEDPAVLFAI